MAAQAEKQIIHCPVLSVKNLIGDIYLMRLQAPVLAGVIEPGQFVNLKVNDDYVPLLRKPFSVCRRSRESGWVEILWKIVGKGTKIMAGYQPGEQVNVLGPLGRGFTVAPDVRKCALVGGGLGVAPLPLLCEQLLQQGREVTVFLGARTESELSLVDVFTEMGVAVHLATEDGSQGRRGLVTEILTSFLDQEKNLKEHCLFSCGPIGLLHAMSQLGEKYQVRGQISIETMMGCGFGICMGCPVRAKTAGPEATLYKLTCLDGPVFDTQEVALID